MNRVYRGFPSRTMGAGGNSPSVTTVPTLVPLTVELSVPPAPVVAVPGSGPPVLGPPVVPEGVRSMPSPLLTWAVQPRKATATIEPRTGRIGPRINVSSFRVTLKSCPADAGVDRGAVFPPRCGFFQAILRKCGDACAHLSDMGGGFYPPPARGRRV